jgi:hypothetical protein
MRDQVEQLQADIEQGVAELVEGEDWQRWLRVASRFPRYSFRNTLLIQMQRPDAAVVMGYRAWQALGHQIRKGRRSASSPPALTRPARTATTERRPGGVGGRPAPGGDHRLTGRDRRDASRDAGQLFRCLCRKWASREVTDPSRRMCGSTRPRV